ncbi:MAG: hypothetical protein ACRDD8_03665, partial [Bacteroidales bacterium]
LGLKMNKNTLRNAVNVGPYSGYNVAMYYKAKTMENSTEAELEEIRVAKDELYKERVRFQDQKREYNKALREEARFERLLEVLKENIIPDSAQGWKPINSVFLGTNQATLLLSDLHIGLEVDNNINSFNKDIAIKRLTQVVDKTICHCVNNNVEKINVVLAGDLISGLIQLSARIEQEEDVITQITLCSEILSKAIMELTNYFDVEVFCTTGNHSRCVADKKANLNKENFERLIFEYLRLKCPNVQVTDSKTSDYIIYEVNGKKIVASHGDRDTMTNAKKHFVDLLGFIPSKILLGHIHHFNVKNDNDTTIIVNGSLISTDDYAMSLRCATKPSQTLIIHDEDDIIIELKLD